MNEFNEGFEVAEVQGSILEYDGARENMDYQLMTLTWNSVCVHDVRLNDNGFGTCEPSEYDMTEEQVDLFVKTNTALIQIQNNLYDRFADMLNDGCKEIQDALGVESGDTAGMFFSAKEMDVEGQIAKMSKDFARYALHEFSEIVDAQRMSVPNGQAPG